MGWFYRFKLHLVVNREGELLNFTWALGNCDDRQPAPTLVAALFGKLFGNKGYLSKPLQVQSRARGVELITKLKSNMKIS